MSAEHDARRTIDKLHGAEDPAEVQSIYDAWSASYDDHLHQLGYRGPQIGAEVLSDFLPKRDGLILDAGCGSGLAGRQLFKKGYRRLHGSDFSAAMLAAAAGKNCYQFLLQLNFYFPLPLRNSVYDAVICIGVMGQHVPVRILDELARVVRPGGLLCVSTRVAWHEPYGSKAQIELMIGRGSVERLAEIQKPYMDSQQADAYYHVLRIT